MRIRSFFCGGTRARLLLAVNAGARWRRLEAGVVWGLSSSDTLVSSLIHFATATMEAEGRKGSFSPSGPTWKEALPTSIFSLSLPQRPLWDDGLRASEASPRCARPTTTTVCRFL